jgi:hypothetical protein
LRVMVHIVIYMETIRVTCNIIRVLIGLKS